MYIFAKYISQILYFHLQIFFKTDFGSSCFVILNNKNTIRKIEEQIGESAVAKTDTKYALTNKTQKHLVTLLKQQKFETRTYFQLYPSDPIPARLYGVIKAQKPEKCYPMRAIVSTIGTLPYGISQYLVELIK